MALMSMLRPMMRRLLLLVLLVKAVINAQSDDIGNVTAFVGTCTRVCGVYETCFAYEGAEYCAPFCAPGRCNATNETCIVEGHACDRAPCLPVVVCEPMEGERPPLLPQPWTNGTDEDDVRCARQCELIDAPVCGSDGVSYANECFFTQAQCSTPSLTIAYTHLCDSDIAFNAQYNNITTISVVIPTTPVMSECDAIVCANVNDPVCTTNGTMVNMCFFRKAQCKNASIVLLRHVACEDGSGWVATCPTTCTDEYVPVCASNGIVYGNECLFRQAKCARQAYGELVAQDLSMCEQGVGDSQGTSVDVAAWLASLG